MKQPVLDHGFVQFIEAWGHGLDGKIGAVTGNWTADDHEVGIIEAARMSTGKGFNGWEADSKLLAYLYNNKHMTPFEMAGMTIEVQAPIFVFREWHRHRTQSYNEMSARYIPLPDTHYMPTVERVLINAGTNKQAQAVSDFQPTAITVPADQQVLDALYVHMEETYQYLLQRGWPKELARLATGVARYSRMRASGNLRNWLAFLTLRQDPKAQWEIRQFANAVGGIINEVFPRTYNLFKPEA